MKQVNEVFICEHCGKEFKAESAHDKHVLGHDIVYVGLERQIWKQVMQALAAAYWQGIPVPVELTDKLRKMKIGVTL